MPENPETPSDFDPPAGSQNKKPEVDLHALAVEIIALLKEDLRIEIERQGRSPQH